MSAPLAMLIESDALKTALVGLQTALARPLVLHGGHAYCPSSRAGSQLSVDDSRDSATSQYL